jgi:hypothetical protein
VVANHGSNTISVFRNSSTSGSIVSGSFASKVDFDAGTSPIHVAIGDLDGDGKPDLAVVNYGSSNASVFRNTSTSSTISFAAKVDLTTRYLPRSVAIGDLDGNGKPDLAVANYGSNKISVFRNTSTSGTISFVAKVDFDSFSDPGSVAIGDLGGNGKSRAASKRAISRPASKILLRCTSVGCAVNTGEISASVKNPCTALPETPDASSLDSVAAMLPA